MIDDYIARFYDKEAHRTKKLKANHFALAKEIVEWKEKVAAAWSGVKVESIEESPEAGAGKTGEPFTTTIVLDTNGLGRDLEVEMVIYKVENGEENLVATEPFRVVGQEGNRLTYQLKSKMRESGVFRYAFRVYPWNPNLPHRQDFAYVLWV